MKLLSKNKTLLIPLAILPIGGTVVFMSSDPEPLTVNTPVPEFSVVHVDSEQLNLAHTHEGKEGSVEITTTIIDNVNKSASTNLVPTHQLAKSNTVVADNRLGQWIFEDFDTNNEVRSTLSLKINKISDADIQGEYCYINRYGGKIDCTNNFHGKAVDSNYDINFISSFESFQGEATIHFEDDILTWKLNSFPDNELGVSSPEKAVLIKSNDEYSDEYVSEQTYVVKNEQAFIYSDPTDKKKTKAYFIKGDIVTALKQEEDWVAISYKDNTRKGWLKISDLDKDRF